MGRRRRVLRHVLRRFHLSLSFPWCDGVVKSLSPTSRRRNTLSPHTLVRSLLVLALAGATVAATAVAASAHGPPSVVADGSSIGGLRIGDSLARANALWGRPDLTLRRRGVTSYRWRDGEGRLVYVRARAGRIVSVEVEGAGFSTRRGDRAGTRLVDFRRRWPEARRYASCCSAAVAHYVIQGRRAGTVLVFTFVDGRVTRVALMTRAHFDTCHVNECD